jgi:hypothetical protein
MLDAKQEDGHEDCRHGGGSTLNSPSMMLK